MASRKKKSASVKKWVGGERKVVTVKELRKFSSDHDAYDKSGSCYLTKALIFNPTHNSDGNTIENPNNFMIYGEAGCSGAILTDNPGDVPAIINFLASCIGMKATLEKIPDEKA